MQSERRPFQHRDPQAAFCELETEARGYLAKAGQLQFIAELWDTLQKMPLSWWSADFTREMWTPRARMRWFAERADIRQRVTTALTGLPPNTAMKREPHFQAELIDSVIDDGDIDAGKFESAFDACEMVVYGPAREFWSQFRERMPWEEDAPTHKKLVSWGLRQLLSERSTLLGMSRKPILTAWDVRSSIDSRVWQSRMPLEIRVAVDEARLRHEKARPRDPFHARHELSICVPEQIAEHIPLAEIAPVFFTAEKNMGLLPQDEDMPRHSMNVAHNDFDEPPMSVPKESTKVPAMNLPRLSLDRLTGT
jgi:hypothetical protein